MLKVFLVEDETVIREGLRDRIPWEQYGYSGLHRVPRYLAVSTELWSMPENTHPLRQP